MGSAERRERERAELRQRILDAARDLFVEEGYASVSMRRVADRIEYSAAALYSHFRDKEELFRVLCDEDFRKFAEQFARLVEIADPIARIIQAGRTYARFAIEHPHHYQLMFMTPGIPHRTPEECADHGVPTRDAYAFLRWTVEEAVHAGHFLEEYSNVDLAAQTIWAGIHGVVSLEIARSKDPWVEWQPLEERVDAICRVLMRGIVRDVTQPALAEG